MINIHDTMSGGGTIGIPSLMIAFVVVNVVFFRDTDIFHTLKQSHHQNSSCYYRTLTQYTLFLHQFLKIIHSFVREIFLSLSCC